MKSKLIHKDFKLQGISYSTKGLLEYLKEKKDYYNFLKSWFDDKDYILTNSSGSTGNPKEIKLKKTDLIESSKLTARYFDLKVGDKIINCLPVKYIAGKMMLVRSLVLGLDLHLFPVISSPISELKDNFDLIAFTPMQLKNSLNKIDNIKNVLVGGATVNDELRKKLIGTKANVFETYGMTETITHIAVKNLSKGENEFSALPGVKIKEKDNCLLIMPGHLSNEYIQTNDVVKINSINKFILLGRKDFIINSGGIKINPEIVEKKLSKYYSSNFIISSINHNQLGEQLVLVFENDIPKKFKFPFKFLEKYEIPKQVFCLKSFPRNNLKINRVKIRSIINNS